MIWPFRKRKRYWFMCVFQQRSEGGSGFYENYALPERHPFDYLRWMNQNSNYTYLIVSYRRISKSEYDRFDSPATFKTFNKID